MITHRCTSCAWLGDEPAERSVRQPFEFQGHRGCETTTEQSCPDCGSDVEECAACQACGENPCDLDDQCKTCIARSYVLGIENLEADRKTYGHQRWWPDVERWVAEERKRRSDRRAAEFRDVLIDITRSAFA